MANPNEQNYFRAGEPYRGVSGKVSTKEFTYFRAGEPARALADAAGVTYTVDATVAGVATVSVTLVRLRALAAQVSGVATVSAATVRDRAKTAAVNGVASVTAVVVRTRTFTAAATGATTVSTALVRDRPAAAAVSAGATVTVSLARVRALTAAAAGTTTVGTTLTTTSTPPVLGSSSSFTFTPRHRIEIPLVRDLMLQVAQVKGRATVTAELSKEDTFDREVAQLLALELIPA